MRNLKTENTSTKGTNQAGSSSLFSNILIFKALADPVRIKIIELLVSEQLCVCHLTQELDLAQPLVSHHLKILREVGLIKPNRYRYWTYYHLDIQAISGVILALEALGSSAKVGNSAEAPKRPCC